MNYEPIPVKKANIKFINCIFKYILNTESYI